MRIRQYKKRNPESISTVETLEKLKLYHDTNDLNIRNEIVVGNMRLINYAIANINREYYVDIADLEQVGYIALINAIDYYNPEKGAFSTFALNCIFNAMKMEIYRLNGFKESEVDFYIAQKKVEHEYDEKLIDNPSLAEVIVTRVSEKGSRNIKNKKDNIRRMLLANPISLEELSEEDNIYSLGYEVLDNDFNDCFDKEIRTILLNKLKTLRIRQLELLKLRYGIDCNKEYILKEISELYNVSIPAIDQNIKGSLKRLSKDEEVQGLKYYLHREI